LILFAKCLHTVLVVLLAVSKAETTFLFLMDRNKLQTLRDKVEAITLPKLPPKQGYYHGPSHDEANQKALAAAAIPPLVCSTKPNLLEGPPTRKSLSP
jgi:hypothetical protein